MKEDPYTELRGFLDRFPLGFPETSSGVEIRILKRLFTEQEARLAVHLSPFPEEAAQIARRVGMEEGELGERLEAMSRKGLIFRIRRRGRTLFNAAPFMIGLYEYSVKKIDRELAALFKEYYEAAYQDEMGVSRVPGFKVLPVEESIRAETVLLPFHRIQESIRGARRIAVAECVCRKEARLTGEGCDAPLETCLSFGAAADYYIENGMGRELTAEEAIRIIEQADEAGLVHAGANAKHLSNICNCCPCCCASLKGITRRGLDRHGFMNALFEAVIDPDLCVACEACRHRCPVGAVESAPAPHVERQRCLGCGLCARACPHGAIALHLREDREEPFDRVWDMGLEILKRKRSPREG
jgi:Pyruvate/2-oxoacid:ferredoxin oxidoreductase delta subunit/DNA-binding Lrp family transcriptional regulator